MCDFGINRRLSTCTTLPIVWEWNLKWCTSWSPRLKVSFLALFHTFLYSEGTFHGMGKRNHDYISNTGILALGIFLTTFSCLDVILRTAYLHERMLICHKHNSYSHSNPHDLTCARIFICAPVLSEVRLHVRGWVCLINGRKGYGRTEWTTDGSEKLRVRISRMV